ncbi:hypothetical protein BDV98DRAFT_557421 [Pterulicium gracile]|uniref:Uncharacterized protein n=1 Tax=Pterulicium gracile TaxID=1884261 RepID=A0A5C3R2P9_9AGAR|nr:hypothetical protein BDV98DRAFT_557421 [Pterula gracilis]
MTANAKASDADVQFAANLIRAGKLSRFIGTINGQPVDVTGANWIVNGNVYSYEVVNYQPTNGTANQIHNWGAYPLNVDLLNATPKTVAAPLVLTLTGAFGGQPFNATNAFDVIPNGVGTTMNVVNHSDRMQIFEDGGKAFIAMSDAQGNLGLKLVATFNSFASQGRFYAIQLVNSLIELDYQGHRITIPGRNTNGQFWYDGTPYPYNDFVTVTNPGPYNSMFIDSPRQELIAPQGMDGVQIIYNLQFRTYFVYDSPIEGVAPTLVNFPVQWGCAATAQYSEANKSWAIVASQVDTPSSYQNFMMPTWQQNMPDKADMEEELRTAFGSLVQKTKAAGPSDVVASSDSSANVNAASRSVLVKFTNSSVAFLGRTSWKLDHGIWTDDSLPPENIAMGGVTVSWESESDGFMTGTEGSVVYTFPDGQTTITIYWDNPWATGNVYSVTLSGPLSSQYSGTYTGGSDDNATVEVTLADGH